MSWSFENQAMRPEWVIAKERVRAIHPNAQIWTVFRGYRIKYAVEVPGIGLLSNYCEGRHAAWINAAEQYEECPKSAALSVTREG